MATVSLSAKPRDTIGKGNARKLRQTGEVPAVIYGHSREPQSLSLNTRDIEKLLTQIAGTSTVVELAIEGKTARTLIGSASALISSGWSRWISGPIACGASRSSRARG